MTLFSYVVRWDHGFAPNPFYGICTLATCKPPIRKKAALGDWVLGTGSAGRKVQGHAVFLMRITGDTCFQKYWDSAEFERKIPVMNGSLEQRFGDNIYHKDPEGNWLQEDSRHSYDNAANERNLKRDTGTTSRVLLSSDFIYWGDKARRLPDTLMHFAIGRRGQECKYSDGDVQRLLDWAMSGGETGVVGDPLEWRYEKWWR